MEDEKYLEDGVIGEDTPKEMHPMLVELHNFLLCHDFGVHFPLQHCGIEVIDDLGCSKREYSNPSREYSDPSRGKWPGIFRGFRIRDLQGDRPIYRISILAKMKTTNHPKYGTSRGTTTLFVGVDESDSKNHVALQLCLDTSLKPENSGYRLSHDGRKSRMGNKVVLSEVRRLAPQLLNDTLSRVNLGYIPTGSPLNWGNFGPTLLNILLYASIRETAKKHHIQNA